MVWQVLEVVSEGTDWDDIVKDWHYSVPKEAIAEAIELAKKTFNGLPSALASYN